MASTPLLTYDWCRETGGALTRAQRRQLLGETLKLYGAHVGGMARLAAGRRATGEVPLPDVDPALVEAALHAGRAQGPDLEGHGLRTWLLGGALAAADDVALDQDLFCVAAITHDAGAAEVVPGQDFTVRSADLAAQALEAHGGFDARAVATVRDGIVAHATAGVSPTASPIGHYVQAGAMLDIAGLRLVDLPAGVVDEVVRRHPAGDVGRTIRRLLVEESRAVPRGRFAQLRALGMGVATFLSPAARAR